MKKVLSVMAVSAFVMTAGVAFAGGPGPVDPACPEACQQQIDDLQSSQAQQNEELGAHGQQLDNHETRITALEALPGYYVRIGGRLAWAEADFDNGIGGGSDDSDTGWGAAIAVGRTYNELRYELELAYEDLEFDDFDDADLTTVMGNLYYDLPIQDGFSVYGMVGIGYGYADASVKSVNTIAYKIGVGVSYMFTEEIAGDLGYEYLGLADNDLTDSFDGHNIVASVRFMF
ncbi:porin family protein [Desulfobulbus rhabdoformis]|uniref:outer membrane protein n=1 Tax=Desulfobulbus rhabdoformis TaxID=34032 RepID=UPI001964AD0D|nr:outer membrane beta-barrel protein [Desulfobulbus rhabdoformis]MBM9614979.1 porin family protein [Desulfobulbus rhabdoformis]